MKRRQIAKCLAIAVGIASPAIGQTTITGSSMALQSSGSATGSGWTLSSDGYVGTYITLSQPAPVTFTLTASGTASNSLSPDMMISIADSSQSFSVTVSNPTNYTYTTPTLPTGTYFVRTQLDNQTATQTPTLDVGSLTVSGTGVSVSNNNTTANATNAATTYATNFRAGPGTITLTNGNGIHLGAGTSVQVKLVSNAFNFAASVYGFDPFFENPAWLNYNTTTGVNSAPVTTEQKDYQAAIEANFNMIVPANAGKWGNNENTQGSPDMATVDAMTQFAEQNGLRVRMHNLIWNTEQPTFVNNLFASNGTITSQNATTLNSYITSRIGYYVSGVNTKTLDTPRTDSYTEMDVFNEPFHGQSAQDNYMALGTSDVANIYQQVENAVQAAGANTRLMVNEYNVLQFSPASINSMGVASGSDPYANWYLDGVQSLQRAGAPIGGLGMELYTNASSNVSAVQMQQAMQNLSVDKDESGNPMPLTLSEFGVASGQTPTAANYDADLTTALTMAYGDPQTDTFGYWGGVGGPNDQNSQGSIYSLYNSTYGLTSAGTTWQSWMSQYNTNLTLTTNAAGQVTFNGTYGLYDVTVGGQQYQLDLVKGTTNYGLMTPIGGATWNGGGTDNNWDTSANWVSSGFAANAPLTFAGTTQLTNNNNSTAGTEYAGITFNPGAGAFVIGGNAIQLGGNIVNNSTNIQTVNLAMALQANTTVNTASDDIVLGGAISGAFSLTKLGAHTLTLSGVNTYSGPTTVSAGTLVIGATGALPANSAVSIAGGTEMQLASGVGTVTLSSLTLPANAQLDITNNAIIINYGSGPDPISSIVSLITSGYNGGQWNGMGIISTTAQSNVGTYGIGYADAADPNNPANLSAGQVEIMYTLLGDANLDGKVNGADFTIMAANFNQSVTNGWDEGDFNYDGDVNGADFTLLAENFNQSATESAAGAADLSALQAFAAANGFDLPTPTGASSLPAVPEPAAAGIAVMASLGILRRRKKRPYPENS